MTLLALSLALAAQPDREAVGIVAETLEAYVQRGPTLPIVTRSSGLSIYRFTFPQGAIIVNLPDEIAAGDMVSGTVLADPAGSTEAEREKNAVVLSGYVVELSPAAPRDSGNSPTRSWHIPSGGELSGLVVSVKDRNQQKLQAASGVIHPPILSLVFAQTGALRVPGLAVSGMPLSVPGRFDGIAKNTGGSLGGSPITCVAESPRQAVFSGVGGLGPRQLRVTEGDLAIEGSVRVLSYSLKLDRSSLRVNESTDATVRVAGVQGIGTDVSCVLMNRDPGVAQIDGGEAAPISIAPSDVPASGIAEKRVRVKAVSVGVFVLTLKVPNSPQETARFARPDDPDEEPLLPFSVTLGERQATIQSIFYLAGEQENRVKSAAATFEARREPSGPWMTIGSDSDPTDGLSATWNRAEVAPGNYTVRVRAVDADQRTAADQFCKFYGTAQSGRPNSSLTFGNRDFQRSFQTALGTMASISYEVGDGHRRRARGLRGQAGDLRGEARKDDDNAAQEWEAARRKREEAAYLAARDKELEDHLRSIQDKMAALAEKIDGLSSAPNPAAAAASTAAAQAAVTDCEEDCEKIKKKIADLEKEQAEMEARMEEIAKEVDALFKADGWTGNARFDKAAGIVRWGFVADASTPHAISDYGSPENKKVNELRKEKDKLKKDLKSKKAEIEKAKEELKACEEACKQKQKALEDAKKAQADADAKAAAQAEMDSARADIEAKLKQIKDYLEKHPNVDPNLAKMIEALLGMAPDSKAEWEEYKRKLEEFMAAKAREEAALKKEAAAHDAAGDGHAANGNSKRGQAGALDGAASDEEAAAAEADHRARQAEIDAAEAARNPAAAAAAREKEEQEAAERDFVKWLEDARSKGWIDDDIFDKLVKFFNAHKSKIPDLIDLIGKAIGGAAEAAAKAGRPGASGAQIGQLLQGLFATIFYWWAEAELRDAVARLGKLIDERTKQLIWLESEEDKRKKHGRVDLSNDGGRSYFWIRHGSKILIFRVSRENGFEVVGTAP